MRSTRRSISSRALTPSIVGIGVLGAALCFLLTRAVAPALIDAAISFDVRTLEFLNRFARRSVAIDTLIWRTDGSHFLEGGVVLALFWGAWFTNDQAGRDRRELVITSLIGIYVTALVAVLLRAMLPFRPRPFMDPALEFHLPFMPQGTSVTPNVSTSFPSGHAIIFLALAVGLWPISSSLAVVSGIYVFVIVCLPRMYLGLHYPTDIVAATLVAIVTVLLISVILREHPIVRWLVAQSNHRAGIFYPLFFLSCLDIVMEFPNVRMVLRLIESAKLSRIVAK